MNDQIFDLQVDKEKILRKVNELQNLIAIWIDTMLSNKVDCIKEMTQPVPSNLRELEIHATIFNAFITISDNLKNGWETHLGLFKATYADLFKYL